VAEGYLRRNDVGYPQRPNPRGIYAVTHFEDEDPVALQDAVNDYLLLLPSTTANWSPHLISTQFLAVPSVSGPPAIIHHCWITLFAAGTISASPT
jgi:hypothetical protein